MVGDQRPKRTTLAIALSARRGTIGACPTSRPAPLLCAAASAGVANVGAANVVSVTSASSVGSAAALGEPSASGIAVDVGADSTVALGKRSLVSVAFCAERSLGKWL